MELFTRENAIIGASIAVALVVFFGLGEFTDIGDAPRYLVLIGIGVVLPMTLTTGYSS